MDAKEKIHIANDLMGITEAFRYIGSDMYDFSIASLKIYCPFGEIFHMDGGRDKAMRVYPATNSAWCFAGCGFFTPTKLIATDLDVSEEVAADTILMEKQYVAPDFESRWDALMEQTTDEVDSNSLSEALKFSCQKMNPNWTYLQLDEPVAQKFQQCVSLLTQVKTQAEADKWLNVAKTAMKQVLGG